VKVAQGDYLRAVQDVEALGAQEHLRPAAYYNTACVFSRCSAAAAKDSKLSPVQQGALKEQYAGRAMEFLRESVAQGNENLVAFKTDPDLEPLRSREDFKRLVQELEQKPRSTKK
jgi:hypothetical protein